MNIVEDLIQLLVFLIVLIGVSPLLGKYLYLVFTGEKHFLSHPLGFIENSIYKILGVDKNYGMSWKIYLKIF